MLAGTYSLMVTSAAPANCQSALATVAVNINTTAPTPATITPNLLTCSTLTANAAVTATAGMSYSWSGPGIVSGATTSNPVVNQPGNYITTVTDFANGCQTTVTVAVSQNTTITNSPVTSGSVTCINMLISLNTPNVGGQTYTWTAPGGAVITSGVNSAAATGSNSGTYSVTVINTTNGCTSTSVVA